MNWETTASEWQVEFGRKNVQVRDLEIVTYRTLTDSLEFLLITITKFIVRPWLFLFGYFADASRLILWQSGQYPEPLSLINSCFNHPYIFLNEWIYDFITTVMVFISLVLMALLCLIRVCIGEV